MRPTQGIQVIQKPNDCGGHHICQRPRFMSDQGPGATAWPRPHMKQTTQSPQGPHSGLRPRAGLPAPRSQKLTHGRFHTCPFALPSASSRAACYPLYGKYYQVSTALWANCKQWPHQRARTESIRHPDVMALKPFRCCLTSPIS